MSVLEIIRMGHPVLRRVAAPVADPTGPEIRELIAGMKAALAAAPGVGLAAPQVAVASRVILYRVPPERASGTPDDTPLDTSALINPVLEPLEEDELAFGWEGCLSIPGLRGLVPRYRRVRYRGLDADGKPVEGIAGGFHARVLQHEVDHLDGVLYLDRMPDLAFLTFDEEMAHFTEEQMETLLARTHNK